MAQEKVWFITGCSTGFGRALTQEALAAGHCVVATARDISAIQDFAKIAPDRVLIYPLDVTLKPQIAAAVAAAQKRFGRIDVLVNNAGYGISGALEDIPEEEIRSLFAVNVFGLFEMTRAVLPLMRQARAGHIFNMSSVAGLVSSPGFGMYNASKHAVEGFSEALAHDVRPFNIRVTLIEPGPFRTEFSGKALKNFGEQSVYAPGLEQFRSFIKQMHGKQPGDPVQAAQLMVRIAGKADAPLRLVLGKFGINKVRTKLQGVLDEMAAWEQAGLDTDFKEI